MMSNINPNEIKMALECCTCPVYDCDSCPLYGKLKDDCVCGNHLMKKTLAYINQLEDSVKDLKFFNKRLEDENNSLQSMRTTLYNKIDEYQAEVERLKEYENIRPVGCPNCHRGNFSNSKFCSHCGRRLRKKEMVGDVNK